MSIKENLERVHASIEIACSRAHRPTSSVQLIAVSKTKPIELIREANEAGQILFGENYVQEAVEKAEALPSVEWHLIGSIQTNKLKYIGDHFRLIHSVDRLKLVLELAKLNERLGRTQDILLQVHVGQEETKQGLSFEEAPRVIEEVLNQKSLRLRGLMALPPLTESESEGRRAFASVREALTKWQSELMTKEQARSASELSMGTSGDYEWAILEGATLVRVGTAIFGARALRLDPSLKPNTIKE